MLKGIVVGLGGRARSWINVCKNNREVELVAFVEPNEDRRRKMAQEFGIDEGRVFSSIEEAVVVYEADFALDVTPPVAHEAVACTAFENGLHVLGEKPISDTFAAARRMVKAGRDAGKVHMITQNYRFAPLPRTARRVLHEGVIGTPEVASVDFFKVWANAPGTHYVTMPYPLLTDMGIHHFDLLRYVLGREAVRVQALSWNPSWGWHAGDAGHTAVIEFEGGMMVTHQSLGSSVGKDTSWNGEWRIDGPEGSLTWEADTLWHTRVFPKEKAMREQIDLDHVPSGQGAVLAEFVSAIKEGRQPECHAEDNLKSLALTLAAVKSADEKRSVELAEFLG